MQKLATAGRLENFKDLEYVDTIVSRSAGAYTHEQVFNLDALFVHNLLLMYYEQSAYFNRAESVKNELRQTNK